MNAIVFCRSLSQVIGEQVPRDPQPRDGRIKEREVRSGTVVLFQWLARRMREVRRSGAACGLDS
jgi:hypothetical protein